MSEGSGKKYDTNPLDQDVYERAEAQMGDGAASVDSEGPTRPMTPHDTGEYAAEPTGQPRPTGAYGQPGGYGTATFGRPEATGAYVPPQPVQYGAGWMAQQPGPQPTRGGFEQFAARGSMHFGLQPNFAAMLCYLPFLGLVASVLLNQYEPRENRFVRFHAKQGLIAHIVFWAIAVAFSIGRAGAPAPVSVLILLSQVFFHIAALTGFIGMMIATYRGKWRKIPIIGDQVHE